jgi:hypothetical protein
MFSFLYHCQDIYQTWLYIWVTRRVSYKKQDPITLRENPCSFWWGCLCCSSFYFYVLSFLVCLYSVSCIPNVCCISALSIVTLLKLESLGPDIYGTCFFSRFNIFFYFMIFLRSLICPIYLAMSINRKGNLALKLKKFDWTLFNV